MLWKQTREHLTLLPNQYGETRCDADEDGDTLPKIEYRIQGPPQSTVERQDNTRKEVVKKLIHQFQSHLDRETLKAKRTNHSARSRRT